MNEQLINVVRKLRELDNQGDKYIQTIPSDINSVFFDNIYVNALDMQKNILIESLFGDMAEDVKWFLYEFEPGKSPGPHCITAEGTAYTYQTDEDYYKYLENCN